MQDAALREAIRRLAACDDRLPVDPGRDATALAADGWTSAHVLVDPDAWPAVAQDYAAGIGSARSTVGGSCALQGYAWRVAGLAIGAWALTGAVLDLGPGRVWVRMEGGRTVGVAAPDPRADGTPPRAPGSPADPSLDPRSPADLCRDPGALADAPADRPLHPVPPPRDPGALADALVTRHLAPVIAASRTASRLSQRVAWGNVASACASVLGLLDRALPADARPGWRADAERFLAASAWAFDDLVDLVRVPGPDGDVLAHERRTCCLMRLAPGKGECGSCERLDPAERRARLTRNVADGVAPGRLVPA
ncbi:IucA/IucC family C-terminal-domain containing protein [Patulibacter sp.]|uniref:IucA/IucC family C-terminal-domain containing protein n=1 Tax=Patulibacter sp. TaxID=1912859 RepID=UPI002725F3AB|nr:IucA/IucC family C-terminal-domain containing protein [Patulibacter sp.]MDO9408217.1 IucA/IucC family C-terminal-domain containing protein [Patulibacter sp.]